MVYSASMKGVSGFMKHEILDTNGSSDERRPEMENVPHKGVKIRELGFKETKDLYEVRESLECRAAGRLPATTCSPTPGSSSHQFSYDRKQIK